MSLKTIAERLAEGIAGRVELDYPLAGLTTYRLGGPAALYVEPTGEADLEMLGVDLRRAQESVPVLALGRGSNLVVSDRGFPGVVVRLGMAFSWIDPVGGDELRGMTAGASTSLPLLANWAARRSLAGMEFAVAIPGSVGGGVRMNAGAHGREISDPLVSVQLFDLDAATVRRAEIAELAMTYRRSGLSPSDIVLDATFELEPSDPDEIRARMESYRRHRAETQPGAVQNAGSVFKNPPGDHAGRLVEAAGLKGFAVGGASVSELHANFFVASDGATAQNVYDLVHEVRARVRGLFGIDLEPEIRFVGAFELPAGANGGARGS